MSQLPSEVSTDADPSDGQAAGQRQQGSGMSRNPRATRQVPRDIRSVDSGYCETSTPYQDSLSPDAVPSNPPSLSSLDLNPPAPTSVSSSLGQVSSRQSSLGQLTSSQYAMSPSLANQYGSSQCGSSVDTVNDIQEHLVHRINRAVGEKDKKVEEEDDSSSMPLPPISSSSSSSASSSSIPSSMPSSVPIESADSVTDADIEALRKEMPFHMRVDFQDAMVLYCEDDKDKVESFMENFEGMKLFDRITPKVMLYDDMAVAIGSPIKALEFGIDRCTYVFLYVTKQFCGDAWSEFSSETCLMEAIHNPSKKWCVVPVFTEPKRSASFRVPPSLNSLKGIQYWTNDKFFKDSVKKLLEEKLFIRRKNEKALTKERKEWVVSHRVKRMKEEIEEREEEIARKKKEQIARQEAEARRGELQRRDMEQEINHQREMQKIHEHQQSQEMMQMMQQFAQRFNVQSSSPSTGLTPSKSDGDLFQCLRWMSGLQNLQQKVFPPTNQTPSNVHQVSLAQGNSLASRQSFQETSGPQAGDEGSTGFCVGQLASTVAGAHSENTQYYSLPTQSAQGLSPAFRSLPSTLQTGATRPESETFPRNDLEEDQPSLLLPHSGASAGLISASQQSALHKTKEHLKYFQGHQSVPDSRTLSGAESIGVDAGAKAGHVPDPPANAKEIHYHYHIYDKNSEKSNTKNAPEQPPINIVGAKIVQIGDRNLVQADDEFMKGGEEAPVQVGGAYSSDEEVHQHNTRQPGTASKPVVSIPSQPPSTIYQDNNPSVPYRVPSTRPVQLPTRPKEQSHHPDPTKPSASAYPAAAAGNSAGSHTSSLGTVPKGSAAVTTVPKVVASRTAAWSPVEGSVGPRTSNTVQGSFISQGQGSMVPPISSGPMAGLSNEASNSSSHPSGPQIALVKPIGAQGLLEKGCDETVVKGLAAQTISSAPQQTGYDSMSSQTVVKGLMEESNPCLEQTLAKERALESEID